MGTKRAASLSEPDLAGLRGEYLASLEVLGAASRNVHQALDQAAAAFAIVRDHIREGGNVTDFAEVIDPKSMRASLSNVLDTLEQSRHQSQRLLFHLLLAEGMSMSEIGRMWGISRQLVSRLVNEPR